MRATSTQQSQQITRLETRNADLDRQLGLSGAQERSARDALRTAETRTKALREEMARLKGTVAQIRGQCANDLRRRDGEIARLKRHLEGRRGREGNGGQVGVAVLTPGPIKGRYEGRDVEAGADVGSPEYSLKQETTDFLTQLSQGLSDENDALIELVKSTLATLRSLQGLPSDPPQNSSGHADIITAAPPSYEELTTSTDEVLEHLRGLLTNPSFVPIEEVEVREEEILRLREGWEKMSARWKEAVTMMDGWRKRMMDTGDAVNIDDLTQGMNLGTTLPAGMKPPTAPDTGAEPSMPGSARTSDSVDFLEGASGFSNSVESSFDELERNLIPVNVLRDKSANVQPSSPPDKQSFSTIAEETTADLNPFLEPAFLDFSPLKPQHNRKPSSSRIPRRPSSPQRTVEQKLYSAQVEAEAARRQTEKKTRRKSKTGRDAVVGKLKSSSRRRSTLSPEELEQLMGIS